MKAIFAPAVKAVQFFGEVLLIMALGYGLLLGFALLSEVP